MNSIFQLLIVLAGAPLLLGVINKTKALYAGRKSPLLLQAYFDLWKLFHKDMVFSKTTTWVFRAGPIVSLSTMLLSLLLIPLGHSPAILCFGGDMILLVALFGLSRFFTAAAALDTGSSFEGMGASREVTFSCFAEPALFLGLLALTRLTGELSLSGFFSQASAQLLVANAPLLLLIACSWFIVLLFENCRIPFDDPNTHLELTMIHEVMVLDHSGKALGMILYGASLKLFILSSLVVHLLFPVQLNNGFLDQGLFYLLILLLMVVIGIIESSMARVRLVTVPRLLVSACLLSAFGVMLLIR